MLYEILAISALSIAIILWVLVVLIYFKFHRAIDRLERPDKKKPRPKGKPRVIIVDDKRQYELERKRYMPTQPDVLKS